MRAGGTEPERPTESSRPHPDGAMADDSLEYAVPRYRDPEKTARILAARRRGERVRDIAVREGVSPQRVSLICRDAGLCARRSTTPPPKACANAECGKLLRNPSAVYCSGRCVAAARHRNPAGKRLYEARRELAATWSEIAVALDWRPDLPRRARGHGAAAMARRYAGRHGLPWPLPDLARSERLARQAETRAAAARDTEETESRVRALLDALPRDRIVTEPEAEQFLVELYRVGLPFARIAARTNCSGTYVEKVVRRRAPELIRPGATRGKKVPLGPLLLDLREARSHWRTEGFWERRAAQDSRMREAYEAGKTLRQIGKREGLSRAAVARRIGTKPP